MKAQRYAQASIDKGEDISLVTEAIDELRFQSYDRANDFYEWALLNFDDPEIRILAANDRFFLLVHILKRKDADNEWCYDRCREVEDAPDNHLDLWARFHYKSTIITFAGIIQEIINDPEITIGIFSYDKSISGPFLAQIKRELENNESLWSLYPDVFFSDPRRDAPLWNSDAIIVRRLGNPKEATVEAWSILALPTGRHFKLRVYDDIINEKSITETESNQIGKITLQWELSLSLGSHDGNRVWIAGTRYHFADVYSVMIKRKSVTVRVHPATHDGTLKGRLVFLTKERWAGIVRDQRGVVAAQMLLNPIAGKENTFFMQWLRPYRVRPRGLNVYIIGDPSLGRTASSDRTAIAVIGVDQAGNRYLLDGYCHRMSMSEAWKALANLFKKWKAAPGIQGVWIGWERYGVQRDKEYFDEKMFQQKIDGMSIDEVAWVREGPQSKRARISRLEPYFRESSFWMPPYIHDPELGKCTWKIEQKLTAFGTVPIGLRNAKTDDEKLDDTPHDIVLTPYHGANKQEIECQRKGERYRIFEAIRRTDRDGNVYDLTMMFIEEFRTHPFSAHDDFLDAVSRVEDMQPAPAVLPSRAALESPRYPDA